jgi:hypothetical protein
MLLSALTTDSAAQTMPAGQVTGRARTGADANASKELPKPKIDLKVLLAPGASKPNAAQGANGSSPLSSPLDQAIQPGGANLNEQLKTPLGKLNFLLSAATVQTTDNCAGDATNDAKMAANAAGTAAQAAWNEVVALDSADPPPDPKTVATARNLACRIPDSVGLDWAQALDSKTDDDAKGDPDYALESPGIKDVQDALGTSPCWWTATPSQDSTSTKPVISYHYPNRFPLFHKGCQSDNQILNFFTEGKTFDGGSQVQYLYNAEQSASSVSGDLLTTTFFPGIQVVLAGTATAGNGTTDSSTTNTTGTSFRAGRARPFDTTSDTTTTSTTDSVQTALTKLQNGGDFNVRVPVPLYNRQSDNGSIYAYFLPNVGFTLNGFGAQQTITESTQYSGNFPLELYGQIGSVKDPTASSVAAVAFMDLKAAGEWISPQLAQKISLSGSTFFPILQASAGVEFAQKFRISMQYIYSTPQFCQVSGASTCASTTTGTTTTGTQTKINGFHLAVSFSPQKGQTSN